MNIIKGDIFDVYQDGQPTRRHLAVNILEDYIQTVRICDDGGAVYTKLPNDELPITVEKVICNINDLEELVDKAWMYDGLNK